MSTFSKDDINKLAHLARIQIDPQAIDGYVNDLSATFDLIADMQQVNTDDIQAMAHPLDAMQRLRADEVSENNQRERFQQLAPHTEAGLYLVPKVLD